MDNRAQTVLESAAGKALAAAERSAAQHAAGAARAAERGRAQAKARDDWRAKYRQLTTREATFERDIRLFLRRQGGLGPGKGLQELMERLDAIRKTEKQEIQDYLQELRAGVDSLAQVLDRTAAAGPAEAALVAKLQSLMESVEEGIYSFKQTAATGYDRLASQERTLETELDGFLDQLEARAVDPESYPESRSPARRGRQQPTNPGSPGRPAGSAGLPAVAEFDAFVVAGGGPAGGWDPADHDAFLRLWNAGRRTVAAMGPLLTKIPALSTAALAAHIQWKLDEERLREGKRDAIAAWKAERAAAARAAADAELAKQSAAAEAAKAAEVAARARKQRDTAVALERWRAERAARKEAEAQAVAAQEAEEAAAESAAWAAKNAALKAKLAQRPPSPASSQQKPAAAQRPASAPVSAAALRSCAQAQQAKFLAARRAKAAAAAKDRAAQEARLAALASRVRAQINPSARRKPLTAQTAASAARAADTAPEPPVFGYQPPPRRATPLWRKPA